MNKLERKIINIIQHDFPLVSRPYFQIARRVSSTEEKVIKTIKRMVNKKVVKNIGPVFSPEKLGYKTALIAAKVPRKKESEIAGFINRFSEVTHNYSRAHEYNLWFTLCAGSSERIKEIIGIIKRRYNLKEIYLLPAKKKLKIHVEFNV